MARIRSSWCSSTPCSYLLPSRDRREPADRDRRDHPIPQAAAIQEQVSVIAVTQLNRASEARAERRPTLANLRESSQLEADSGAVILLHRDGDLQQNLDLTMAKHQHGLIGEASALASYDRAPLASLVSPRA